MEKRTIYKTPRTITKCAWCGTTEPDDFCMHCGGCTECCKPSEPACDHRDLPVDPAEDMSDDAD